MTFNGGVCQKCGKKISWFGELKDHPGCKCGWKPDLTDIEEDEKMLNEFREMLKNRNPEDFEKEYLNKPFNEK